MTITFDCEGCGAEVYAVGIAAPPANGFCGVCDQLNVCLGLDVVSKPGITLDEFWKLYERLRGTPCKRSAGVGGAVGGGGVGGGGTE